MERFFIPSASLSVLEELPLPMAVYQFKDSKIVPLAISDGFCELFGYQDREKAMNDLENDLYQYSHPDDAERLSSADLRFATQGGLYDVIYRTKNRNGSGYKIIHAKGKKLFKENGEAVAYIWYTDEGVFSDDLEDQERALAHSLNHALHEESIVRSSHYDFLTGLPNMSYFFELAELKKRKLTKEGKSGSFMFIDLNGMKYFNHKYGFEAGDRYLQSFAEILVQFFGKEDCAHLGQDHFGAVAEDDNLEEILQALIKEAANLNNRNALSIRVGIFSTRMDDVPVGVACDRAKLACDAIRGVYGSAYRYYTPDLRENALKKRQILEYFDEAMKNRWIQVYYQPLVRTISGKVCDEEALARWNDPRMGFLSPGDFIPSLEEAGVIYKLDLYVVDRVIEKIEEERKAGLTVVPHSVNLSRSDFSSCDIVEEIRKRVDRAGLDHKLFTIELTESVIGQDFDFMKSQIERFQALGFPVWMDDFGSGYSSLDVLQSVKFDLLKFDMSFMRRLNDGGSARVMLTELMKMATALGIDTVCEGVENIDQVHFLQEIGCSKLQGFYFCKPIPFEEILNRYREGRQIGFENPEESGYYEAMGRVNLYDFEAVALDDGETFHNFFNTLPMGIIEVNGSQTRFARSNQSYRDFVRRFLYYDLRYEGSDFTEYDDSFMYNIVKTCCEKGVRSIFDETMPDGSVVHSFARRIGVNPVNGNVAVAVAVLSVTAPNEGTTYAEIARALASDYYNIYYVNLETEQFIEYSSRIGGTEMAVERHGDNFFAAVKTDANIRIYEADRKPFLEIFTKENIIRELEKQSVFTATYRLIDSGTPMYVNMKITRMEKGGNRIIIGISIIDSQKKREEVLAAMRKEQDTLARVMALSEDYLSLYSIDSKTGGYIEYSATDEYERLGFNKTGENFFLKGIEDGKRTVYPEDLPAYLEQFTKENILEEIEKKGIFKMQYRLVLDGKPRHVTLKIAPFKEGGEEKLFAGVRAWKKRK